MRVISGSARGHPLLVPKGAPIRPTQDKVRGAIFSMLGGAVAEARVLDLFAGTGALGIEALSRGAASACFVESNRRCLDAIRQNLAKCRFEQRATIRPHSVESFLVSPPEPFELVFADPPYAKGHSESGPHYASLLAATFPWLAPDGVFILEFASDYPPVDWAPFATPRIREYGETAVAILAP